jgi:hypothetical protein
LPWWKIILEPVLAIIAYFLGINLWALLKSPSHLKHAISDKVILKESLDILGIDQFIKEANDIQPAFRDHKSFIARCDNSHNNSLSIIRNLILIPYTIVLVISGFIGTIYLVVNLSISLLAYFQPINLYAKNNNIMHIHTIMLNIHKWNTEDKPGCENYCTFVHPEYLQLYKIIDNIKTNGFRS